MQKVLLHTAFLLVVAR